MDLNMLAIHGASGWRVRTRAEFDQIIEAAELVVASVVPTTSAVSVIECAAQQAESAQGQPSHE
jgi:hypothetical protein